MVASILDIAPSLTKETIEVAGQEIEVRGISNSHLAKLMYRFPKFGYLFSGASGVNLASLDRATAAEAGVPFDPEAAANAAFVIGEAMPAIIAAGVGHPGEASYEEAADRMDSEDQKLLYVAIMRLTQPKAKRPLADAPAAPVEQPVAEASSEATQA